MVKRLVLSAVVAICLVVTVLGLIASQRQARICAASSQDDLSLFKNNNCVTCHNRTTEPLMVSHRYLEWQISKHREKGVGCEKCHGGDPGVSDQNKAHEGVIKPYQMKSRLYAWNQPETCGGCHQNVVTAFTQSNHYQKLKRAGLGPACNTCHVHMATKVVYSPDETASLCSNCHNTINGLLPPRPDIPERARDAMFSLQRADFADDWTNLLMAEALRRGRSLKSEQEELKAAHAAIEDARIEWHTFNLDSVRSKADSAFHRIIKVRDALTH